MPRTTRRNTKPEPFWRDLIARWRASGQTVAAFCAAHRVSQATFYSWRHRLAARGSDPAPSAPTFAPVRVIPDLTADVILPAGSGGRGPVGADPGAGAPLVAALGDGSAWPGGCPAGSGFVSSRRTGARASMGSRPWSGIIWPGTRSVATCSSFGTAAG